MTYSSQKYGGTGGKIFNDDKTPEEALLFYKGVLKRLYEHSTDDVTIYWWFANRIMDVNMQAFREEGWHLSQVILWLKNSIVFSPGQLYHRIYEPCMVGWKDGKSSYKDKQFSSLSELWNLEKKDFASHLDIWYQKRDNTNKYVHPTQKPVQLAERALKRSSEENDIILDVFGGSGSTMIACEQMNRSCYLIELDPKYCDVIVQRYVNYTEETNIIKNGHSITWPISNSKKHE
jgi:DNA modification methylase